MARPKKSENIENTVEVTDKTGNVSRPVLIQPMNLAWLELKIGNFNQEDSLIVNSIRNKDINFRSQKQPGNRTTPKVIMTPEQEYAQSLYRMPNNAKAYGLPASGFKKAMATAAKDLKSQGVSISSTTVTRLVHVMEDPDGGGYVQLHGDAPNMREDIANVDSRGKKVPVKRYRGEFKNWYTVLRIRYDANSFAAEDIINLCARAGATVGFGELRPEKGYSHGMWSVDSNAVSVSNKR